MRLPATRVRPEGCVPAAAAFTPLRLAADGTPRDPVVIVDLDRIEATAERASDRSDWFAAATPTVGRATGPLSAQARAIAERLTCTLVPTGAGRGSRFVVEVPDVDAAVGALCGRAHAAPRAVVTLDGLLRSTEGLHAELGVVAESFAYSMLLGAPEFAAWREARPAPRARFDAVADGDPVRVSREGDVLEVVLDRPRRGNAFSADLRQALVEALELAMLEPSLRVRLSGAGRHFSTGGDLAEFGTAEDLAAAHAVRLHQSAGLAAHRLSDRLEVRLHGRCIGAGIEVPAFAARVVADPSTTFWLPELDLGLIPGAGGTVSIPARIGRWRTAYLVLSGAEIDAATALAWGLVDVVE